MISVCALCCVHSSIPTIAMVIAQHKKAYICKRFLRKRIFRLIMLDIVKDELLFNEKPKCNECMWMFEVNITYAPLTHTCWTKPMLIRRFINIKKHAQWSMCWGSSSIHTLTCTSTPSGSLCTYNRPVGTAYLKSVHTHKYEYQRTISDKRDRIDAIEFELKRRSHKSHYRLFHSVEFLTHLRSGV